MARYVRFTFICDTTEREQIRRIAEHMKRSQSDAVRLLVNEKAIELAKDAKSGKAADVRAN